MIVYQKIESQNLNQQVDKKYVSTIENTQNRAEKDMIRYNKSYHPE